MTKATEKKAAAAAKRAEAKAAKAAAAAAAATAEESNQPKETKPQASKSVIPHAIKRAYGKSQSCGDDVATIMKAQLAQTTLAAIASQNGLDLGRWSHLNPGMQRMNLGNVIRGMVKRGEGATIGDKIWAAVEI